MSSSLSLPASSRTAFCFAPALPFDARRRVSLAAFLRKSHGLNRLVCCLPAPGRQLDAFPRGPLLRATLPAAPPQALRATHTTVGLAPPFPACRLSLLLTASHPRVLSRECSRGLGCAGSGDPATDPHSYIRDSLPSHGRSSASAFGARGSTASVSRPISGPVPSVHSPLRTSDSALCYQRAACLPNRLARVHRGLTPAGPSLRIPAASPRRSVSTALTWRRPARVVRHRRGARMSKLPQLVRHSSPGLEMVNIWRTKSIKIQTNFSLNQTNFLLIQTNSLKLQTGIRTNSLKLQTGATRTGAQGVAASFTTSTRGPCAGPLTIRRGP